MVDQGSPLILAGQHRPGHLDAFLRWILNREPDIKNIMTGWANKKPPGDIIFLIEHRMKTIFVTTCRTDLKLGIHFDIFNFVIHKILLLPLIFSEKSDNYHCHIIKFKIQVLSMMFPIVLPAEIHHRLTVLQLHSIFCVLHL